MVRFECSRCGRCCIHFGRYITIKRQLGRGRFSCHSHLSGEHFIAQIIEDRSDRVVDGEKASPCPFLRKELASDRYLCAIYPSRPGFCRDFKCSHMDIFNTFGERIGRVGGKKTLLSKDQGLIVLWEHEIAAPVNGDAGAWFTKAQLILEGAGYRVMLYE